MAVNNEEVLDELYGWDSTIDEMYERGKDHTNFDEDAALEAYEEMIQIASASPETYNDAVLSLAAQLLTKHFYKFPHVHQNVVKVLLGLCTGDRAQAVRIHTVRSLLQIVKNATSTTPGLVQACRDHIADRVAAWIESEGSNVIVRHLTQLQETLKAVDGDMKKKEQQDERKEGETSDARDEDNSRPKYEDDDRREREPDDRRREQEQRMEIEKRERREARFRGEKTERDYAADNKSRDMREVVDGRDQRRRDSYRDDRDRQERGQQRYERSANAGPRQRDDQQRDRRQSGKENGNGCPPSSFIFIGGVPRSTYHEDIINYLSCIDESVTHSCVQIKFPNSNPNAAGYAFVSLDTVDHARKAIRHIKTTEFNGRNLIGDFARGPPCSTLQFVERNPKLSMHEVGAVSHVDVDTIDRGLWDELCDSLKEFGAMDILPDGRIRFRDTESAKSVIRKHRFYVGGREFLPVYDPEEQAEIDSSQRRQRSGDNGGGQRGGDLSRYGGSDAARRGSRDDGDRKRRRSQSFDRGHRDKQTRRDKYEDAGDRNQHPVRREFDQARYGPRDSPSSFRRRDDKHGDERSSYRRDRRPSQERDSEPDRRGREEERRSSHGGSFRSPPRKDHDDERMSTSSRHSTSNRGRSRSRSSNKRDSEGGAMVEGDQYRKHSRDARRSRSPMKSNDFDDRRRQESDRRDQWVPKSSNGRSASPNRGGNGTYNNRDDNRTNDRRDFSRRDDHRPQRFGGDARERNSNHSRGSQRMAKYGTVGDRERSPSPPRFQREDSNTNNRGNRDQFRRGEDGQRDRFSRYGNENRSRNNRVSPPGRQSGDYRDGKRQNDQRGRSPSPENSTNREQTGRRHSRSPSPINSNGRKKHRTGSPRPTEERGRSLDQRPSRSDSDDGRKAGNYERRGNRNEGRHTAERSRDDRRGQFSREQHSRTPSPVVFDGNDGNDAVKRQSSNPSHASPKGDSYEEIDECAVDYDEDE